MKKRVLFICTHNSARSQMAEAFLRFFYGDDYEALSAGTEPREVHPYAIKVMAEAGIDISGQKAKSVENFIGQEIDLVVTVCDQARETCPYFPSRGRQLHQSFPDPSSATGSEEERLDAFRRVRDEMRNWVKETFAPSKWL